MILAKIILIVLALAAFFLTAVALSGISTSRKRAAKLKELEEIGVVTQSEVLALREGGPGRAHVTLRLSATTGEPLVRRLWLTLSPDLVVGNSYPVVRHPQYSDQFEPGPRTDLARKREREQNGAQRNLRKYAIHVGTLGTVLLAVGIAL
ncbi:hypothetical protein ABT127_18695 [Streptomyces sp. NPDC001904]|uniref:hypothetical protein n=1 Tax=Streptomyces sp. NPDC001904 TaxID=3154531 RepID=UPI003328DBE3